MTTQIPDTVVLCGHLFEVTRLACLPSEHPAITDVSEMPDGVRIRLPKCSALHRGYTAAWEIRDDGSLYLTSLTHGFHLKGPPLHADWVTSMVRIPVGEIDETRSRELRYELVRESALEFKVVDGMIHQWRLVKGFGKGIRWQPGFDWPKITAMLTVQGISSEFQPASYSHTDKFSSESLPIIARQSADLLHRANLGDAGVGKELAEDDWDMLHRGWADPFPKLDFHDAVRAFRGHGPPLTSIKP
jgi:hypothetical protein